MHFTANIPLILKVHIWPAFYFTQHDTMMLILYDLLASIWVEDGENLRHVLLLRDPKKEPNKRQMKISLLCKDINFQLEYQEDFIFHNESESDKERVGVMHTFFFLSSKDCANASDVICSASSDILIKQQIQDWSSTSAKEQRKKRTRTKKPKKS